jgi:glycosyltransferase involved in cell wall biosynthesis
MDSLLAQTYPHWELIIIDDGSTDGTARAVTSVEDPRVHYTYQENRGQAAALNRGLELAQGTYVTTLDCDDWLPEDSLSVRVDSLQQHPELGAVYSDGFYCDGRGEPLARFAEHRPGNPTGDIYDDLILTNLTSQGAAVVIRRCVLEQHDLRYDESIVWCQDWDFYIRLASKTRFGYVDVPTVYYRLQSGSMSVTLPEGRRLESLIKLKWKVLGSSRFQAVAPAKKGVFFRDFLINTLQGRLEEQCRLLDSSFFHRLPHDEQGHLLRLAANHLLLRGGDLDLVRHWLGLAAARAPADPKARLVRFLVWLHPALARMALRAWHAYRHRAEQQPLWEQAVGPQPSPPGAAES